MQGLQNSLSVNTKPLSLCCLMKLVLDISAKFLLDAYKDNQRRSSSASEFLLAK